MIYALLADGFEEIEAVTVIDILRRAGKEVAIVGITEDTDYVSGAHGIKLKYDITVNRVDIDKTDVLFLPGGMPGTKNLADSADVNSLILRAFAAGKTIAAICAAPMVLGHAGILNGIRCCCFPGFESELAGAVVTSDAVVLDRNIITARGVGVAIDFALKITEHLCGAATAEKLKSSMQCR